MGPPKKNCEVFFQKPARDYDEKKGIKMSGSSISPELIWNEIKHIGITLEKIEQVMANLPCDDLSDRIVRLEEARNTQEKANNKMEEAIGGAFKLAREAKQETFNKFWKIGVTLFAGGIALLNGVLLYLIFNK